MLCNDHREMECFFGISSPRLLWIKVLSFAVVSEMLPDARASHIAAAVKRLLGALAECPDDTFTARLTVISKLLEIWSEGDDVDVRCNDPPRLMTVQLSAADVQQIVCNQTAPGLFSALQP